MDNTLHLVGIAKKARRVEVGEEPVGAAARAGKAHLIVVASDASDHSWRRAKSFAAGTSQQCLRLGYTKDELGQAIGRDALAMAAVTDAAMALALVQSLEQPEKYGSEMAVLEEKVRRAKQRRSEQKAHQKNVRMGKKKVRK